VAPASGVRENKPCGPVVALEDSRDDRLCKFEPSGLGVARPDYFGWGPLGLFRLIAELTNQNAIPLEAGRNLSGVGFSTEHG
jgi:hypothetical protein